jgi:30S ribosomal protein S31
MNSNCQEKFLDIFVPPERKALTNHPMCSMRYMYFPPNDEEGGVHMGKGDQRTKRGKIFRGTYGKRRPKKKKKKRS